MVSSDESRNGVFLFQRLSSKRRSCSAIRRDWVSSPRRAPSPPYLTIPIHSLQILPACNVHLTPTQRHTGSLEATQNNNKEDQHGHSRQLNAEGTSDGGRRHLGHRGGKTNESLQRRKCVGDPSGEDHRHPDGIGRRQKVCGVRESVLLRPGGGHHEQSVARHRRAPAVDGSRRPHGQAPHAPPRRDQRRDIHRPGVGAGLSPTGVHRRLLTTLPFLTPLPSWLGSLGDLPWYS